MKHPTLLITIVALAGCSTIEPNTVRVEAEHLSHLTQHRPFTDEPTNYGLDSISAVAHWGKRSGFFVELGEGVIVDRETQYKGERQCGGFMGPRELFTGRIGYTFRLKGE